MKQPLLRRRTNAAACMVLLVMSVISFHCIESPSKLVGPTYDTQLSIPVLDTTNYFSEFVQKDSSVFRTNPADSTSYITIFSKYSLPIPIDSITHQPVQAALGEFGVKGFSTTLKDISAIDGIMNCEFTNRIPIALSFKVYFLKLDSLKVHSDTLFKVTPDSIIKAPAVDINGYAINPIKSNIPIVLTGEQIDMIPKADSIYFKIFFNLSDELKTAKFRKDDYIRNRTSFTARYTINKPQRENGK